MAEPLLLPEEAAALLRLTPKTLANWRWRGGGPPYVKFGGVVRYRPEDLEAWVQAQRQAQTSEPGEREPPLRTRAPAIGPRPSPRAGHRPPDVP